MKLSTAEISDLRGAKNLLENSGNIECWLKNLMGVLSTGIQSMPERNCNALV